MNMKKSYSCKIDCGVSGLTLAKGFRVAAAGCDIRGKNDFSRLDLAMVVSDIPADAAGVFTTNDVKAAPVIVDIEHLKSARKIAAVVAHSGIANACTGERGLADARKTCAMAAEKLGVSEDGVLVCSTGRIGDFLPMKKIERGIGIAHAGLSRSARAAKEAARAIMTTDTRPKTVAARVRGSFGEFTIAAMAKGAGMIEPNMATMLAFIACDAKISKPLLRRCLKGAVQKSFNRISVDGDMSTNDTVLCLCNGAGGAQVRASDPDSVEAFSEALSGVCLALARMIVSDGEKISRVIEVNVRGARNGAQAEKICRSIANSMLVKCAWFGGDPNWGRITDAAGYARTGIDFGKIDLSYGDVAVVKGGVVKSENERRWKAIVGRKSFSVNLDLHIGSASDFILTTDLTDGYVIFNKGE